MTIHKTLVLFEKIAYLKVVPSAQKSETHILETQTSVAIQSTLRTLSVTLHGQDVDVLVFTQCYIYLHL